MACGIGVCMTCVLPVRPRRGAEADGGGTGTGIRMVRACTEGPVFPGDAIEFDMIGIPPPPSGAAAPVPPASGAVA
jgi:dihydroorotate dehydrogenase electron transfer subunit